METLFHLTHSIQHRAKNIAALTFCLFFVSKVSLAQEVTTTPKDSIDLALVAYTSLRGHMALFNDELELQGNASRVGVKTSITSGKIRLFLDLELAVNLIREGTPFNTDQTTESGFFNLDGSPQLPIFGTRLAFGGVDLNKWGVFTLGKQWGLHYDVTGMTDRFNVFGGQGSVTYVANTDGGTSATGRANQALVYRNRIGPLEVGGLLQFNNVFNESLIDGSSLFLGTKIGSFRIGASYTRSYIDEILIENVPGLVDDPEYYALGAAYAGERFYVAFVYADQSNGDLVRLEINDEVLDVVFNAKGYEFFARYQFDKLALLGGFNFYDPDKVEGFEEARFKRQDYLLGIEYHFLSIAYFYLETRLAFGENEQVINDFDVLTAGLRIDLDKIWKRRFPKSK